MPGMHQCIIGRDLRIGERIVGHAGRKKKSSESSLVDLLVDICMTKLMHFILYWNTITTELNNRTQ